MEKRGNWVVATAFMAISLLLIAVIFAEPRGRFVVVVSNPLSPPARLVEIIGNADGAFVANGRFPWIAIAYSTSDEFPTRLLRAGAILVLNNWAAAGCMQRTEP